MTSSLNKATSIPAIMSPGIVSPSAAPRSSYASYAVSETPPIAVRLGVKRFKLAVITLVALGLVATALAVFRSGVTLTTVERSAVKTDANEKEQEKLLDKYNSYTGNAASALTKPIEVFATMALQLVLLRFAARAMVDPRYEWRLHQFSALAAWALLYLLLNGFNSLNVQLRPQRVIPTIETSDLSSSSTGMTNMTALSATASDTSTTHVVPESTPGNLVTNTVLRTAIVPRKWPKADSGCDFSYADVLPRDGVEFGFPIRSFLGQITPAAPTTSSLSISLTDNATTALDAAALPMNASRAAMMFVLGVHRASDLLGWFQDGSLNLTEPVKPSSLVKDRVYPIDDARARGVLPVKPTGSETSEREWLLRETPRLLKQKFAETKRAGDSRNSANNDTEIGLSMRFSHVDITPRIVFDAVTFEAVVNPDLYYTVRDPNGTARYLSMATANIQCGPKPSSVCTVEKMKYGRIDDAMYDLPIQIQAAAMCVNENGSEMPTTNLELRSNGREVQELSGCNGTSSNSIQVISIAKRIVVDAVVAGSDNAALPPLQYPVLVNARKIYSITVGRLAWESEDLAAAFGAQCNAATPSKCEGIQIPLADLGARESSERLVASVDALPVGTLEKSDVFADQYKYTPLLIMHEPLRPSASQVNQTYVYKSTAGDLLLPHNILVNRTNNVPENTCPTQIQYRLNNTLANHLYMEDGVQPAYTSGLFWLFQNAVVKSVVTTMTASTTESLTTLAFDGNVQVSALVASIPETNVWLSLAGCILLATGVVATTMYSGKLMETGTAVTSDHAAKLVDAGVAQVSDPRVIAQVLANDARFPPMFLDRQIVHANGNVGVAEAGSFQIASMTLEGEAPDGSKKLVTAKNTSAGDP